MVHFYYSWFKFCSFFSNSSYIDHINYHTQKHRKTKFFPRVKFNHNIHALLQRKQNMKLLLDNLLAISTIICKTRHVHHNFLIMKYMLTICNILMKIYSKPDNIVPISLSHKAQHGETMQTCLSYQGKFKFDISASYYNFFSGLLIQSFGLPWTFNGLCAYL